MVNISTHQHNRNRNIHHNIPVSQRPGTKRLEEEEEEESWTDTQP
jgi:hypothetical protein